MIPGTISSASVIRPNGRAADASSRNYLVILRMMGSHLRILSGGGP